MLAATEARIEAIADSPIGFVGSALQMSAVLQHKPKTTTDCYVVPVSERPQGNKHTTGPALQRSDVVIGVVFVVRALNDPAGLRGSQRLTDARDAVRDVIYGWTPPEASARFLQAGGELVRMEHGTIWWIDRYMSQIQRRSNPENLK